MAEATEKSLMAEDQPPPTYTATTDAEAQDSSPPSYSSLFGEIKAARQESSGVLDFFKKFVMIVFGTIGFLICMSLFLAIPVTSIVIGALNLDKCTIEPKIPIYLIVLGSFGIVSNLMSIGSKGNEKHKKNRGENVEEPGTAHKSFKGIIDCFLFAWFICGNVWIYKNYAPVYNDVNSAKYCDQTLYLFAFWLTTATYIVAGVVCVCGCFVAICAAICAASD